MYLSTGVGSVVGTTIALETGTIERFTRPRASEILNRQRPLTLSMIRLISQAWQLPAEPLIREYQLANRAG